MPGIIKTDIFDNDVQKLPRKFVRVAAEARRRPNLVVRNIDMKRFDEEVASWSRVSTTLPGSKTGVLCR
jgi:hypothetical protein